MKTGVQQIMLGSVTGSEKAARETLAAIKESGYDGVELNGFMIRPTSFLVRMMTKAAGMPVGRGGKLDWARLIQEAGLSVISVHEDLGTILREPEKVIEEARSFGTDLVVITGMYRFDYGDPAAVRRLAGDLNEAGRRLSQDGIRLLYHNHNCEFVRLRGNDSEGNAYQVLIRDTDPAFVNFELDTYWPTEAGVNALELMQLLGERVKLWHINDRGTRVKAGSIMTPILKSDSMELGYGNMDLGRLMEEAKRIGVEAVILESHRNWVDNSPVRSLQVSAEWLRKHLA